MMIYDAKIQDARGLFNLQSVPHVGYCVTF